MRSRFIRGRCREMLAAHTYCDIRVQRYPVSRAYEKARLQLTFVTETAGKFFTNVTILAAGIRKGLANEVLKRGISLGDPGEEDTGGFPTSANPCLCHFLDDSDLTMTAENSWVELLKQASVMNLHEFCLEAADGGEDIPSNLLHLACQYGASHATVHYLIESFPHQLVQRDAFGKLPLHYACCAVRSFSALPVLQMLVQAAPETILMRSDDSVTEDRVGILPALLAHTHGAQPSIVQFLLQQQFQIQRGLILTHSDLTCLHWNEASFWEHVAFALQRTPGELIEQISLQECRIAYPCWTLLQHAINMLPAGSLRRLQLIHLHIWYSETSMTSSFEFQRQMLGADAAFWQRLFEKHFQTLECLEMPHFYALTTQNVHNMAQHLAQNQLPRLETLDVRPADPRAPVSVDGLALALSSTHCKLKSLSLGCIPASGLLALFKSLYKNRTLEYFAIGVLADHWKVDWNELHHHLLQLLQCNTALERFHGPRPLVQCPQVQLYLRLNREYHRREYWPLASNSGCTRFGQDQRDSGCSGGQRARQ
jgi:hypothetical protein